MQRLWRCCSALWCRVCCLACSCHKAATDGQAACLDCGTRPLEWLLCAAPAERWQPLGEEWSTPPTFATHPGVKPLGGVAPGWQAEVGGQSAFFPR